MAKLTVRLFGTFQVKLDEQPVLSFRSNKARALFAYLLSEGGVPLSRGHLAELLWHGYQPETAQTSLRGALSMVLALSLPATFAQRSTIVTLTFGVVVLSIVVQGVTMGPLLRRLRIGRDATG